MVTLFFILTEEASGVCRPWDGSSMIHSLSGSSGTFFSPDYPAPYPKNARCIWTITVPAGKRVKLKFEDFGLETVFYSCMNVQRRKIMCRCEMDSTRKAKSLLFIVDTTRLRAFQRFIPQGGLCGLSFTPLRPSSLGQKVSKHVLKL